MAAFFVSYTRSDHAWAEWIAWELESAGYTTILQAWDFGPGSNFILEMQRAAAESERTIAVLSPAYLSAAYTQSEWAAAVAADPTGTLRKLLPIRVRPCEVDGILRPIVYLDLVGLSSEEARRELLAGVAGSPRRKPKASPRYPGDLPAPPFPATSAPIAAQEIRFLADCVVDETSIESSIAILDANPRICFHPAVLTELARLEDWWAHFDARSEVFPWSRDNAAFRQTDLTRTRAQLRDHRDRIASVLAGIPNAIKRCREVTREASEELRIAALAQLARFLALQIIRLIQFTDSYLPDSGPVPHVSFPTLPRIPAWLVDLVPNVSAIGELVFQENQFLLARVGSTESECETLVVPRYVGQYLHRSNKPGDENCYYRWILPQWLHYRFERPLPGPDSWRIWVLTDGLNRECWSTASARPWET